MDLLWEKFQWILPLYMKPISFQSKASVVCSVTEAISIDFCLKKLNVLSQHISKKKWISEFRRTNPQELKCWSTFCVNYFLRYYLMMQHQPGLSPDRCQAIIWTNAGLLLIGPLGTNFSEILIEIFIQENAFECVVCETAAILSWPQCVKVNLVYLPN